MKFLLNLAMAILFLPLFANANCGSAFCNLNTDWDIQSVATKPGVHVDLRAEYINQDELRHGTHKTKPAGEVGEHDEIRTINRNYLATVDWNINADWAATLKLPFIDRAHKHVHNEDDGLGGVEPELEKWDFSGLGDIQALGRYRFYADKGGNAGVRFGLKLPTGDIREKNGEGELAERSLQPGTGSVDALLGAYYNHHAGNLNWFAQGMWQQAVSTRDNFKPGRKLNVDAGLSYSATPDFSLMLQLNLQHKSKDTGSNAEPAESGSRTVSLSPGLSYAITHGTHIYGFVQAPIYQYVRGTQLTSDWSAAVGINTSF
jgi:Putative MetA-pathway of phenol degradation